MTKEERLNLISSAIEEGEKEEKKNAEIKNNLPEILGDLIIEKISLQKYLDCNEESTQIEIEEFFSSSVNKEERTIHFTKEQNKVFQYLYWEGIISQSKFIRYMGMEHAPFKTIIEPKKLFFPCFKCGKEGLSFSVTTIKKRKETTEWINSVFQKGTIPRPISKEAASLLCPQCKETVLEEDKKTTDQQNQRQESRDKELQEQIKKQVQDLRALPYKDYLQTKHWKNIKEKALKRFHSRCSLCNTNKQEIHIHHRTYEHRGEEQFYMGDLIALCKDCHKKFHDIE